ncbi:MAG: flagellar FlbD family protein [Eubacteriales bacterium]|nr:flagellar FlbD family protein [Eubacteriales bacterium]
MYKDTGRIDLINVHRLNNEEFLVNCELIEFVEETPNTVISMVSGRKVVVSEPCSQIKKLVIGYKRKLYSAKIQKGDK